MSPRMFANVVYAWLMSRAVDGESRARIDATLYAPVEGADALQRNFLANITAIAAGDG